MPGIAHGRASRSSREYGRNGWSSLGGAVRKFGSITGNVSAAGMFHGSDELAM